MRLFNILSALAQRKNVFLIKNATVAAPETAGTFDVASIQVTEPGVYLVGEMLQSSIGNDDILLITNIITTGKYLTQETTARGTMSSGGGVAALALMELDVGDTVTGRVYQGQGWPAWNAQMSLFAIKLVGGVINTLRRAVTA